MKKILIFAVATAVAMSSCSKNEVTSSLYDNQEIGFSSYTGLSSKGAVTYDAYDGFGVFGYYTNDAKYSEGSINSNFIYNSEVSSADSGKTWTYNPVKYWSEDVNDYYSFFGYSPYSGDTGSCVAVNTTSSTTSFDNTTDSAPVLTFSIATAAADMVDFVAGQDIDVQSGKSDNTTLEGESADEVQLTLMHQLSRVKFSAVTNITSSANGADATTVVVKKMEILTGSTNTGFAKSAEYKFAATTDKNGTWSNLAYTNTDNSNYNFTTLLDATNTVIGDATNGYAKDQGVAVVSGKSTTTSLTASDNYLFLIPVGATTTDASGAVTTEGITSEVITIQITYDIVTEDSALENEYTASIDNVKTVTLPAGTLQQGVAYIYKLKFSLNEVVISATVDTGWNQSTVVVTGGTEGTTLP